MSNPLYDVVIVGGGPAAVSAGVYVARKQLKSVLVTEAFGGQSIVSDDIQNWIGEPHISGIDLAKKFEDHIRSYPDVLEVKTGETATGIKPIKCNNDRICDFEVTTTKGSYQTKAIILSAGARHRKLGIPGEEEFDGKGVAYCSTCDAPLFSGKDVAVVGGGNAGLEAVQDLFPYATKIYLMLRKETPSGDPVTLEQIKKNSKLEIITNAVTKEVFGKQFVTGVKYTDLKTNEEKTLNVGGLFVEIGSVPNSEFVKDLVDLDKRGQVIIDSKTATTSHPGIFAAGDITDDPFKQNNISAGDGVKAALSAYGYLLKRDKTSPTIDR